MEPLWSPVVATVGNQRQIAQGPKPQKQAKSVATGCHRLPEKFMLSTSFRESRVGGRGVSPYMRRWPEHRRPGTASVPYRALSVGLSVGRKACVQAVSRPRGSIPF
jgi:hypothetical protein